MNLVGALLWNAISDMPNPISILIIDNSFTFGGAINSLENLLKALNKNLFQPVVVSGQPLEYLETHFPDCDVHHYQPKLPWINNHIYQRMLKLPMLNFRALKLMLNLLRYVYWLLGVHLPEAFTYYRLGKKADVSLVHLNNILGSQLSGILAAKMLRVPCIAHLRDFEEVHPITCFYARLIHHHVAISSAIRDNLLDLKVPKGQISIVHDALDLNQFNSDVSVSDLREEFKLGADELCFGLFGRIVPWKGTEEFLRATRLVVDQFPSVRAFIVGNCSDGDEDYFHKMQQLVTALKLADHVVFTGFRSDVPAFMKMMDIVVHASIRPEPFGMVVIEGMAMAKSVVATRGGGPLDIVEDNKCGILVDIGDIDSLANAISRLAQSAELRKQMGEEGRRRVEAIFSNTVYAARMEKIYQDLLSGTTSLPAK